MRLSYSTHARTLHGLKTGRGNSEHQSILTKTTFISSKRTKWHSDPIEKPLSQDKKQRVPRRDPTSIQESTILSPKVDQKEQTHFISRAFKQIPHAHGETEGLTPEDALLLDERQPNHGAQKGIAMHEVGDRKENVSI